MADKIGTIEGGTAFYDSMWKTLDLLDRVRDSRKAIVVLTDGMESPGRVGTEHSFAELLERVTEEDAVIYPIHLDHFWIWRTVKLGTRIGATGQPNIGATGQPNIDARINTRVHRIVTACDGARAIAATG